MCKPEFFETGRKMRDAEEAVENVRTWLRKGESASVGDWARTEDDTDETRSGSNWIRDEVVTELGAVLRLKGQTSGYCFGSFSFYSSLTSREYRSMPSTSTLYVFGVQVNGNRKRRNVRRRRVRRW